MYIVLKYYFTEAPHVVGYASVFQVQLLPDVISHSCLLNCFDAAKQWQQALQLFYAMPILKATGKDGMNAENSGHRRGKVRCDQVSRRYRSEEQNCVCIN